MRPCHSSLPVNPAVYPAQSVLQGAVYPPADPPSEGRPVYPSAYSLSEGRSVYLTAYPPSEGRPVYSLAYPQSEGGQYEACSGTTLPEAPCHIAPTTLVNDTATRSM